MILPVTSTDLIAPSLMYHRWVAAGLDTLVSQTSPFGGGYFLALPGVADGSDYLARALLA